jgi:hypothetical protein
MNTEQQNQNTVPVSSVVTQNNFKVYTKNSIPIGALLFGPVAGCYMLAKNFEFFGDKPAAKKTWIILLVSMAIYGIYLLTPFTTQFINILPILYTVIIYSYTEKLQGKILDEHIKSGGKKYSGWKVLGVGILSILVTLIYIFVLVLFIKPLI